jgi:(2Fe-2S) ferredoxin
LGRNPDKEIITVSYSGELAQDFGSKTRSLVNSGVYQSIFNTRLKEDEQAKAKWKTQEGGSYTSVGVGGAITGRGANILIFDDPIKNREEAESEVYREKVWQFFTSTAYTRLEPKAVIIVILTRWHVDDLAGRIMENDELSKRRLQSKVDVRRTGCHGFCERGPLVVIYPQKILYQKVKPEDASTIFQETVLKGKILENLLYEHPTTGEKIVAEEDVPFYKKQMRIIFGDNGSIDPTQIEDYIAVGGYRALAKALFSMAPDQIISEVKKANLRGRGGGGFPAGLKWEQCRNAPGDIKYVICNADEGDPGAYMDRSLLEGNPHSVLEGMIIGAYAIGAHEGYVYVRNEYPLAVVNIGIAIQQAKELGFWGRIFSDQSSILMYRSVEEEGLLSVENRLL